MNLPFIFSVPSSERKDYERSDSQLVFQNSQCYNIFTTEEDLLMLLFWFLLYLSKNGHLKGNLVPLNKSCVHSYGDPGHCLSDCSIYSPPSYFRHRENESSALAVVPSSSAVWLLSLISTYFCSGWLNLQCSVKEIWICSIKCSLFSNVSFLDNNIQLGIVYGTFFSPQQQPPCVSWFCVHRLSSVLSAIPTSQNGHNVRKQNALWSRLL